MKKITLRAIVQERLGEHYLTAYLTNNNKDNKNNYEKTIEREQNKFKKILKAYGIEPSVFKVGKQYQFPLKSKNFVLEVLDFNLKKTPIHKLNKKELQQNGFNDEQLKEVFKMRKVINKLIGYQINSMNGLNISMIITSELGINELKAEEIINEKLQSPIPIQQRFSAIFDEEKYPNLTLEQRVDIFNELQIELETYLNTFEERIESLL
ncbi:hypothetical protein [Lysinibacillus sp. FSL M8-0355]|uniref:hypothetical protein n=1 Tax=Lysinibacillus sp. FSL M8-0355 TaxID=2921719 RepID=UPI0030FBCE14